MSLQVGILHPGAMGVSVAATLKNSACEVYWVSQGRSLQTRQRADSAGLSELASLEQLCQVCSLIVSVCPPGAAETVADDVIAAGFKGLYLDANAIAPQRAIRIAAKIAQAGARFVDGGIVGGPAWQPGATWLYLSGPAAAEAAAFFRAGPLETETLGEQIGLASALKMSYAAYSKGVTALLCAALATAEQLGVRLALEAAWERDEPGFAAQSQARARRVTAKAWRFSGEMQEIAQTFQAAGLPAGFHLASADLYARLAHFKDRQSLPELAEVLRDLREPTMIEKRVPVNGIQLQVRQYPRPAPALVLLHFGGANLMIWEKAIPFFEPAYHLVMPDLRGHGKSDRPQHGYTVDEMADDIAVLIEQLNLGQAHIIGSSVGAEVGLSLAARYPERVLSLVCDGALANEFGPYSAWQGSEAEFRSQAARNIEAACSSAEQVYPSLDALVAARRPGLEQAGWWNEAVENYLRYGACEIAPGQFGRCWQSHAARQYLEDYFFNLRLEKTYSQVQCPVLLLPDDETLQDSAARAAMEGLASLASQAQIAQAPGWIHPFGWMINPVPAIQAILPFLEASTRL